MKRFGIAGLALALLAQAAPAAPGESVNRSVYLGSESRLIIPL